MLNKETAYFISDSVKVPWRRGYVRACRRSIPILRESVLIGPLDEWGLLNKLSNKFERFANVPTLLNEPKVSLKGRLQNFFEAIENEHNQPLLYF